jgi:hypothetical protein
LKAQEWKRMRECENAMDSEDKNPQYYLWEINSAAVHCKEVRAPGAETIYVPGGDSEFAGATYVSASSAASGNEFVHINFAGMAALTQTDESALFVVTPIRIWPRWQPSKAPSLSDCLSGRGAQDEDLPACKFRYV